MLGVRLRSAALCLVLPAAANAATLEWVYHANDLTLVAPSEAWVPVTNKNPFDGAKLRIDATLLNFESADTLTLWIATDKFSRTFVQCGNTSIDQYCLSINGGDLASVNPGQLPMQVDTVHQGAPLGVLDATVGYIEAKLASDLTVLEARFGYYWESADFGAGTAGDYANGCGNWLICNFLPDYDLSAYNPEKFEYSSPDQVFARYTASAGEWEKVNGSEPLTPIPLPAGVWMLSAGLLGLSALRTRG